jgi:hypothetical protein
VWELLKRFEELLALFENLKAVAGELRRLATFYTGGSGVGYCGVNGLEITSASKTPR